MSCDLREVPIPRAFFTHSEYCLDCGKDNLLRVPDPTGKSDSELLFVVNTTIRPEQWRCINQLARLDHAEYVIRPLLQRCRDFSLEPVSIINRFDTTLRVVDDSLSDVRRDADSTEPRPNGAANVVDAPVR